jgi:putative endonuclease
LQIARLFCFMKYFVYILQSEKDQSFYIGYSENPAVRLEKHNSANSGYTSTKQPWKIVYTEEFETKGEALKREKFLKRQKNRSFCEKLIKG